MRKKSNFTKIVQLWGIIFLIGIGGSIIVVDIIRSYRDFNFRADQMRVDYTERQKQMIKREVDRVVDMIHYEKSQNERLAKERIKSRVYEAHTVAKHIYQENKSTKSEHEIQQRIKNAVSPIRFEEGCGYYFISRLDGVAILFPSKPELEGKNLLEIQDSHGKYFIKDIIQIVKQAGESFYQYNWTKPNTESNDFKKISFIKQLGLYDWFIGTGLYVDDVERQIKKELLNRIAQIRFGPDKDGYIFVVTYDGTTLMNDTQRHLIGKNIWELTDPNGVKVIQEERKAVENPEGDFIYYSWSKPSKKQISPKVSFMKGFEEWEWMIGAGVYLDDVEADIALIQTELNNRIKIKMLYFILIIVGIIAFFLFLFSRLNRRLQNDFNLFLSFFNRMAFSDEPIDRALIQFEELERVAENANKMLADRKQAEEGLKASEARYSTIFQEARDGIVLIEAETGLIIDCNPYFEKMTGRSLSALRKMKIWEVRPPDKEEKARDKFYEIKERTYGDSIVHGIQKPDGTIVPIDFVSKRVGFQNKDLILSVVRDITERKQAEEAFQKMEKLKSVGTLAGGIAHDFNNILTGLFGNISIAKETLPTDHPGFASLEEAEKSMNRAIRLTKQLLTFAKGGAPVMENIRLDNLVEEVIRFDLSGSNVKPIFEYADDLWPAEVDGGQIQQVFSNLTINARQAMPDGGHLYITLENAAISENKMPDLVQGKYIRITVTDEGTGIDRKHIGRIFEPYFTTKHAGSGLGLATSHSIIHQHGGCIRVDSQLGKGAMFIIYLPASKTQQPSETKQPEIKCTPIEQTARILVMDDEEMIRNVATLMLEKNGYWVETANGGSQAIEMYQQAIEVGKPFDVVITDLTIPGGIGGKEVIRHILEINPKAKVIVSSGYANDPIMAKYADYGFSGVVAKPYTLSSLHGVLSRVLGK
jgi:two-component system cell cycle sensor histidine kinase/response regulator CckA